MDNKIFTKQIRRPPGASARLLQLYEHTTFIGVLLIPVPKTRVPNKCAKQKLHGKKRWYFYNFIEKNLRPLHFPWLQSWTNRSLSTIQRVSLKICREERSLLCGKDSQLFNNNSTVKEERSLRILPSVDDSKSPTLSVRVLHTICQVSANQKKKDQLCNLSRTASRLFLK